MIYYKKDLFEFLVFSSKDVCFACSGFLMNGEIPCFYICHCSSHFTSNPLVYSPKLVIVRYVRHNIRESTIALRRRRALENVREISGNFAYYSLPFPFRLAAPE